jgi:hypothetical protein
VPARKRVTEDQLYARACALVGGALEPLSVVRGGGNNRIYRARGNGRTYAIKSYPDDPVEAHERLDREFTGLAFLWSCGERRVPEPIAFDAAAGIALYGWIDGSPVGAPNDDHLAELAAFACSLDERKRDPEAARLRLAREAVLSRDDLGGQMHRRLARLRTAQSAHPELTPLLREIEAEVVRRVSATGEAPLAAHLRTLSPSDFGFHNALQTPGGLAFLDFEYFGWDDPVKLVSDVVWHPGMALVPAARRQFVSAVMACFSADPGFRARFERDVPLYGLRWALIVLGEFLPEVWARRVAAGAVDRRAVLERQLAKAVTLLERSRRGSVLD